MKVKELKALLAKAPDEMEVLIPLSDKFDGRFMSPCKQDTGVAGLGGLRNGEPSEDDYFVIVPCGFFHYDSDHKHELN